MDVRSPTVVLSAPLFPFDGSGYLHSRPPFLHPKEQVSAAVSSKGAAYLLSQMGRFSSHFDESVSRYLAAYMGALTNLDPPVPASETSTSRSTMLDVIRPQRRSALDPTGKRRRSKTC